jgi:hypothetical protein
MVNDNGKLSEQISAVRAPRPEAAAPPSRRDFIRDAAAMGAGVPALATLAPGNMMAQAASPAPPAPAAAPKRLTYNEVMKVAREKLYPRCRVFPECDGWACSGEMPGFGGRGNGGVFPG